MAATDTTQTTGEEIGGEEIEMHCLAAYCGASWFIYREDYDLDDELQHRCPSCEADGEPVE